MSTTSLVHTPDTIISHQLDLLVFAYSNIGFCQSFPIGRGIGWYPSIIMISQKRLRVNPCPQFFQSFTQEMSKDGSPEGSAEKSDDASKEDGRAGEETEQDDQGADKEPKERPEAVKRHEAELLEGNMTTAAAASLAAAAVKAKVGLFVLFVSVSSLYLCLTR